MLAMLYKHRFPAFFRVPGFRRYDSAPGTQRPRSGFSLRGGLAQLY